MGATGTSSAIPFAGITASGFPVVAWGTTVRGSGVPHAAFRSAGVWHASELVRAPARRRRTASTSATSPPTARATR